VFHSPQLSQRPDHLDETAPQDWQTNCEEALAIPPIWRVGLSQASRFRQDV